MGCGMLKQFKDSWGELLLQVGYIVVGVEFQHHNKNHKTHKLSQKMFDVS